MVSISLSSWLHQQAELKKNVYAIVDPNSIHQPHVAFYQCDGQDGAPLMNYGELLNSSDGPWLLYVNATFMQWWQQDDHASSGILVATNSNYYKTRVHFASLFHAKLFGEVVLFPFYNPQYLSNILPRLEPEELTQLLRNHSVLLKNEQEWQGYQTPSTSGYSVEPYKIQVAPWWVIRSHHLDNAPNVPLLSLDLESWMWKHQHEVMKKRQQQNQPDFKTEFHRYYTMEDETLPFMYRVVKSTISVFFGTDFASSPKMSGILKETENDEMLYALKYAFAAIQR